MRQVKWTIRSGRAGGGRALAAGIAAVMLGVAALAALQGAGEAQAAAAPFRFAAPAKYDTGADKMVALQDVTGDGHPDIVTRGDERVAVLAGRADGTFEAPRTLWSGWPIWFVEPHDVNGDGVVDLVAISEQGITVMLGSAAGAFSGPVISPSSPGAQTLDVGDINGDGKVDLAESFGYFPHDVSLQLGAGDGTFAAPTPLDVDYAASDPQLVDLNGDGCSDLILAVDEMDDLYAAGVLLADGKGGFGAMKPYNVGNDLEPCDIAVGDMNDDGVPDLVLDMTEEGSTDLGILLGNGRGGFRQTGPSSVWEFSPHPYSSRDEYCSIALGDFDGDGRPDVAAAKWARILVVRCDGAGRFLKRQRVFLKDAPAFATLWAADLNGDGRDDLVSWDGRAVSVRLSLAP